MKYLDKFFAYTFRQLKEVRENWFPWVVILIGTATYAATAMTAANATLRHSVQAIRLEQVGTAWILFGAMWTALGTHLTRRERASLDLMLAEGKLDAGKIVNMFKAASNFSTYGAIMIVLGTAALLFKMFSS